MMISSKVAMEERMELAKNLKILRFSCTKCGKCCKDSNTFINLNYRDILRFHKKVKMDLKELMEVIGFYTFKDANVEDFMIQMVYTPIETEQGLAYIGLLKDKDSRCVFLDDDDTCKIHPYRPSICRSFPFTFLMSENEKKITGTIGYTNKGIEYCPGIKKSAPIVKKKKMGELLVQNLADIAADAKMAERWNNMVRTKQIPAKAAKYIAAILLMDEKIKESKSSKRKS
jgi:Fe-S-cluster containining protein